MKNKTKIEVEIKSDGKLDIDFKTHEGKKCTQLIKFLTEILGEVITKDLKDDYFKKDPPRKAGIVSKVR